MNARNLLALVLALLTGLVLGQLLVSSPDAPVATSARTRSTQAAATAFYESVNQYLETGDADALARTLDTEFLDHSGAGGDAGATSFVRYLAAMRATWPDMRLQVTSMTSQADIVAVAIATTSGTVATAGALVADRPPAATGHERLRIAGGRIAERWASATLPPQFELISTVEVNVLSGWFLECAMDWLTLEPGEGKTLLKSSHSILIASAGSVTVDVQDRSAPDPLLVLDGGAVSQTPIERGRRTALASDSVLRFPPGEAFRIWNTGEEPATAIVVELRYRSPAIALVSGVRVRSDPYIDDERQMPAELMQMDAEDRPIVLSLVRIAAAPNEPLPVHAVAGLDLLLVADGSLEIESHAGSAFSFGPAGRESITPGDHRTLSPGTGMAASGGALLSGHVTGDRPAVLWFVTLVPVAAAAE